MHNEILKVLADNPALLAAVRETIEKHFSIEKLDTTLSNEQMGEVVRAKVEGKRLVQDAFREIERYKTTEIKEPTVRNPAR